MAENENPTLPTTNQAPPSSSMAESEIPETYKQPVTIKSNPYRYENNPHPQQIFTVDFGDNLRFHVTVTSNHLAAEIWARDSRILMNTLINTTGGHVAGFEVEGPGGYDTSAAILTICVSKRCLMFQLEQANSVPPALMDFLNSVKLVTLEDDLYKAKINASKHGNEMNPEEMKLLELRPHAVATYGINASLSYEELMNHIMGLIHNNIDHVTLSHEITTSDWTTDNLTEDQVMHASFKAIASYSIGNKLRAHRFFPN